MGDLAAWLKTLDRAKTSSQKIFVHRQANFQFSSKNTCLATTLLLQGMEHDCLLLPDGRLWFDID